MKRILPEASFNYKEQNWAIKRLKDSEYEVIRTFINRPGSLLFNNINSIFTNETDYLSSKKEFIECNMKGIILGIFNNSELKGIFKVDKDSIEEEIFIDFIYGDIFLERNKDSLYEIIDAYSIAIGNSNIVFMCAP